MSEESGLPRRQSPWYIRWALLTVGTASLVLGLIGIIIPILPTTPFLLLSAVCYAHSSDRFYRWLVGNRLFGSYINDYREGTGLPWRVKGFTLIMLWLSMGITVVYLIDPIWLRAILIAIAVAVTFHIVTIRTKGGRP